MTHDVRWDKSDPRFVEAQKLAARAARLHELGRLDEDRLTRRWHAIMRALRTEWERRGGRPKPCAATNELAAALRTDGRVVAYNG